MSFDKQGYVLKPARMATANSQSTGEAVTGVLREHIYPEKMTSLGYDIAPTRPVEPYADMYTAAVLNAPEQSTQYAVFAANTSQFSIVEDSFAVFVGAPSESIFKPLGGTGFTSRFGIKDEDGRSIASIIEFIVLRGDTIIPVTVNGFSEFFSERGVAVINSASEAALGGGFSYERGDSIISVRYLLSAPKYWWSRNDDRKKRFMWQGSEERWTPIKGGTPVSLGIAQKETEYKLFPPLSRFEANDVLPFPTLSDDYCIIRYGLYPDATSDPLHTLVVSDNLADAKVWRSDLGWDAYQAVVGVTNGQLLLNPTFIDNFPGIEIWYNSEDFDENSNGAMVQTSTLELYSNLNHPVLSPVPEPGEYPFVRIGFRTYLIGRPVGSDSDLPDPLTIPENEFYYSLTTGKTSFSTKDIKKATPGHVEYKKSFLLSKIYYDGVVMSSQPNPLRKPVAVLNKDGNPLDGDPHVLDSDINYLPPSTPLPPPGISGVLYWVDGSGDTPKNSSAGTPQTRPRGLGLSRKVKYNESFFFNTEKRMKYANVKEYEEDQSLFDFTISSEEVQVAEMVSLSQPTGYADTSRIKLRKSKNKNLPLYFIQVLMAPSHYVEEAKIYSRIYEPYNFNGTESFTFSVDGVVYSLTLPQGEYTAEEVANILNGVLPSNTCGSFRGRVYIANEVTNTGSIEIGYNGDPEDLSGHSKLGFLPTWRVEPSNSDFRWLPDTGATLSFYRSPTNIDGLSTEPDLKERGNLVAKRLRNSVPSIPFELLDYVPLEDVPGFDEDLHFKASININLVSLPNYGFNSGVGIKYEFEEGRIAWTEFGSTPNTSVLRPDRTLQLQDFDIIPETLSSDAMTNSDFGLYLKPIAGSYSELVAGQDYLMLDGGSAGQATLINNEAPLLFQAGGGVGVGNSFQNPVYSTNPIFNLALQQRLYLDVGIGNTLIIKTGLSKGVYRITSKSFGLIADFETHIPFPVDFNAESWEIYNTKPFSELDLSLVCDVKAIGRSHFPSEPFKIRILTLAGTAPNPLSAPVGEAVSKERETSVRVGLQGTTLTSTFLEQGVLIGAAQPSMNIPDLSDPHFSESSGGTAYFQIRIGAVKYNTTLGNLTLNSGTTPTTVDVNTTTGEILIGSSLLDGSFVYYDQLFRDPTLTTGAEVDPATGDIVVPSTFTGDIYFVEELVVDNGLDVIISPLNGAIFLNEPLKEGQIVEANYFVADSAGDKLLENDSPVEVTEFLPHIIRLETCTKIDSFNYSYNASGNTIETSVEPFVWVGGQLKNYAGNIDAFFENGVVTFTDEVPDTATVKINYGILEARGGEQSFNASRFPVYRKPFFLEAGVNTFTLETDRRNDFSTSSLMLLGTSPFYITSSTYDASTDLTTVEIFPTPVEEVGSRSPGNEAPLSTTDFPIYEPIPLTYTGFMLEVASPYERLQQNGVSITFVGDLTEYAKPNHLLEIGGVPYIIGDSELSEEGDYTKVSLTTPIINSASSQPVKISSRAIAINLSSFPLPRPHIDGEDLEVFIFREDSIGEVLVEGFDFELNENVIEFVSPFRKPLAEKERLYASYTRGVVTGSEIQQGAIVSPKFKGQYLKFSEPTPENRILGSSLFGQYSFRNPDCFFFDIVSMSQYIPSVVDDLISGASSSSAGCAIADGSVSPEDQGSFGIRSEVQHFRNKDRAARIYTEFFNKVIVSFEQILETMDGRIIGDRDGKFNNFIGKNKKYAPPGWEDRFTGRVNPRLLWREIIENWADPTLLGEAYYTIQDPVVSPTTAYEKDPVNRPGDLDGDTPDPDTLRFYIELQKPLVRNDMEDVVLVGFSKPNFFAALFPSIDVPGKFKYMWRAHALSRLYPEITKHFTRVFPGAEAVLGAEGYTDKGFFTPGRTIEKEGPLPGETQEIKISTRNSTIAVISNPAIGEITGIVDVTVQQRYPRARVWAFYPEGNADMDALLGTTTAGIATFVLTPTPLSEFPLSQGFPNTSLLISQGGDKLDIESGDNTLSNPPFEEELRISFGTPNGASYILTAGSKGVYVKEVQVGCVITLQDGDGNAVIGSDISVNSSQKIADVLSENNGFGDTVFGVPNTDFDITPPADDEAATLEQTQELLTGFPDYNIQGDIRIDRRNGEFLDATLPGKDDDFPIDLQSLLGQRILEPLTTIEGEVSFVNSSGSPVRLPCLLGQDKNDSGDYSIPYVKGGLSEKAILANIQSNINSLYTDMDYTPLPSTAAYTGPYGFTDEYQYWDAAYPDEILISDGAYYFEQDGIHDPAVIYTTKNLRLIDGIGIYQPDTGIGSIRRYDLLFVQANQAVLPYHAFEGIHTVGEVTNEKLEIPRFVCETGTTDVFYTARNYAGHKGLGITGVLVTETVVGVTRTITFDFSSTPNFVFAGESGIISLLLNAFAINVFDPDPAGSGYMGTFTFNDPNASKLFWTHDSGAFIVGHGLTATGLTFGATSCSLDMNSAAASPLTLLGLVSGQTYDFTLELDTYIDNQTSARTAGGIAVGSGAGSTTGRILSDRLTFKETLDFRTAFKRGEVPADGSGYEMEVKLFFHNFIDGDGNLNSVNSCVETNNNQPFTILERIGPDPFGIIPAGQLYVGVYDFMTNQGYLKVMSWERGGNISWGSDVGDIIISAAPSSDIAKNPDPANQPIGYGTGVCVDEGTYSSNETVGPTTWVQNLSLTSGSAASINSGDICILEGKKAKDGTYLVRHAIDTDGVFGDKYGTPVKGIFNNTVMGFNNCFDLRFPSIKSVNATFPNYEIVLKDVEPVPGSPTGHGFPSGTFLLYVINENAYASHDGVSYTVDPDSVYTIQVQTAVYDAVAKELTCTNLINGTNAVGAPKSFLEILESSPEGKKVSGMTNIRITHIHPDFPSNNVVGAHTIDPGGPVEVLQGGVRTISIGNSDTYHPSTPKDTWNSDSGDIENMVSSTPASGNIGVEIPTPVSSNVFLEDITEVIYARTRLDIAVATSTTGVQGVPTYIDISNLTTAQWNSIHFDGVAPGNSLKALLPKDVISLGGGLFSGGFGFIALSGIFLEPSFPKPVTTGYSSTFANDPRVVTNNNPFGPTPNTLVGMRQTQTYTPFAPAYEENQSFIIRRLRRWQDAQVELQDIASPLKYVYEMRRGLTDFAVDKDFTAFPTATGATNLGGFLDPDVNINPGDLIKIYNPAGELVGESEIRSVVSDTELKLRQEVLGIGGGSFEIYLRQPIVPHEQSLEELFQELTTEVVFEKNLQRINPSEVGGRVTNFNELLDDDVADWTAAGVQKGDYLIIDPQGTLYLPNETGVRPFGDQGISDGGQDRVADFEGSVVTAYTPLKPDNLDDNRGFYKVGTLDPAQPEVLIVDGTNRFAGGSADGTDNVIFGDIEDYASGLDYRYSLLPTISDSSLPTGSTEGQQALRPTAPPNVNSYVSRTVPSRYKSIEPLQYKIIRPSPAFSEDAIELILFMRERNFSWIEEISEIYNGGKAGNYYVFQKDDHILDVTEGIFANTILSSITGSTNLAPYLQNTDCLSILDRRFHIVDTNLDNETNIGGSVPFTQFLTGVGSQRPLYPEYIEDVLNYEDNLRGKRYAWINTRVNLTRGSATQAEFAEEQLAENIQKEEELTEQRKDAQGSGRAGDC